MNPLRRALGYLERRFLGGNALGGATFGMTASLPAPVLSGVAVTPETALTFGACFACINVLATDLASLPLEVKRKRPGKGTVAVPKDPRYDMVYCEPNRNTTSMRFRQAMYGHRFGWGNAYAEVKRFKGMPVELHLHSPRPTDTWPERSKRGEIWYQLDGGRRQARAEDVLHIAGLGWNGLVGYSPVALQRQAIGYGIAIEQFGAAFYGNAITPKIAIKLKKVLTPEAIRNLRESWDAVHQGAGNAHRTAILEEGHEIEKLSISPEDAQYLAARTFQAIEMCRIFRVPPHKIMDYSQAGSAYRALEESNLDYITSTLGPEIEGFDQELNRKLFTRRERAHGLRVAHDFGALLRGNMQARGAYLKNRLEMGSITPDQIAEREGDPPVPGPEGKKYFISANLVPLERAGTVPPPSDPPGENEDEDKTAAKGDGHSGEQGERSERRYNHEHDKGGKFAAGHGHGHSGKMSGNRAAGETVTAERADKIRAKLAKSGKDKGEKWRFEVRHPLTKGEGKASERAEKKGLALGHTKVTAVYREHTEGKVTHHTAAGKTEAITLPHDDGKQWVSRKTNLKEAKEDEVFRTRREAYKNSRRMATHEALKQTSRAYHRAPSVDELVHKISADHSGGEAGKWSTKVSLLVPRSDEQ